MAEAAILFAVEKLSSLLIHKVIFLQGVEGQVKWLKDELQRMQCFLKDAVEKQSNDERIRKWISDIRDVAQDAEDVIETFVLKVDSPRNKSKGLLESCTCIPNHVYYLDKAGEEIESIRDRIKDICNSRERYGIQNLGEGAVVARRSEDVEWRRQLSPWQKDKHIVGLNEDVQLVVERAILRKREGLSIASIVGMGGIGKSTLARIVYNHAAVADRFERRAWVCVSSEFSPKEIIKELVLQMLEPAEDKLQVLDIMDKSPLPHLKSMLHERLKNGRYFIVLDDVWEREHWESLASAFPDEDKASKLLLTSRNRDITKDARYVHEIKFLDPEKSWELFLNKAFIDGYCPRELEAIGRHILQKYCKGLPLAITVIGGLLVKQRQSIDEWKKLLKGMHSHLRTSGTNVSAILELSYHNLPPQLKSCFLCLGLFKEDATIRAKKLIQVWIAHGLIQSTQVQKETLEEIARDYLDELINRNMLQVKDMSKDDRVKTCQIHDLLRELSITKAKEEIKFEILREDIGGNCSQSSSKTRHRAIYCGSEQVVFSAYQNNHLRSLFFYGPGNIYSTSTYWKNLQLLRVLDFENFGLEVLPETIGELTGLRYLGLRNNDIKVLPSSLGRLKNLHVLDISLNFMVQVPNVIWKMDSLRHIYMSRIRCKAPLKLDNLKNLQTLTYIPGPNWTPEHTIQMTSLGKLGVELEENSDVIKLCTSLSMLTNIFCLNFKWYCHQGMAFQDGLGKLRLLTQLKLQGRLIKLPSAADFPPNLAYLSLYYTVVDKDPMPELEKLPKLQYLKLDYAYTGEEMVISQDGFPKLKVLSLRELFRLRNIQVGDGGMAELRRLEIYRCPHLESLPEELKFMNDLQELKMVTTPEIACKIRGIDADILSNIPSVHLVSVPFRD